MKKVSVHFNSVHDTCLLADCIVKDIPGCRSLWIGVHLAFVLETFRGVAVFPSGDNHRTVDQGVQLGEVGGVGNVPRQYVVGTEFYVNAVTLAHPQPFRHTGRNPSFTQLQCLKI